MKKISIIVPVYNAEEYLDKCINTILMQTEKDLELILVDDGSDDNSLKICEKYKEKDTRVKTISYGNEGVSAARNHGMEIAEGKYIGFVDSDDWIDYQMYERLLDEALRTNADVVMCDATTVFSDGRTQADTITQLPASRIIEKSDFTPSLLAEMAGSACRCIYKNNRYCKSKKSSGFYFPTGVKFSEDRIFNIYAFGYASRISYLKESYYNRFVNEKSTVNKFHEDYFEACKKAALEIDKALKAVWNNQEEYRSAYYKQFVNGALMAVCNYYYKTSKMDNISRRRAVIKVCEDAYLQNVAHKIKTKNLQTKLLIKKRVNMLILYAKLANRKHGR